MTKRTYTTKSGDIFEWDETPEVKQAIEELHSKFSGNYPGPLYAPHPELNQEN